MENTTQRSWFSKPEGKVGAVGIVIAIALLCVGAYFLMPFMLVALTNTLHTILLLGAIGFLLALVINPASRNFFVLGYKMVFKGLTSIFITLDPMMILKDYVQQLYGNLEEMARQIGIVKGTRQGLKAKIKEYSDEANQLMERARVAQEKDNKTVAVTSHRAALRRQTSVQKLSALEGKIEMILRVLGKMHENCGIMAEDTKDEVNLKEDEWNAIKSANNAMKSAMSVINGGGDKRANFEQAMEYLIDDISLKMGEMENFMDMTEGLMASIDLDNEMFDDKMVANLDAWEQKSDSWILGEDKGTIVQDAYDPTKDVEQDMSSAKLNIFG